MAGVAVEDSLPLMFPSTQPFWNYKQFEWQQRQGVLEFLCDLVMPIISACLKISNILLHKEVAPILQLTDAGDVECQMKP